MSAECVRPLDEPAVAPVRVVVVADDALSSDGAKAALRGRTSIDLLTAARRRFADVVLLVTDRLGVDTMAVMREVAAENVNERMRIVLVACKVDERYLMWAIECGLASVLQRRDAGPERVARAVLDAGSGRAEMPRAVLGQLLEQVRAVQRDVLAPNGLTAAGLHAREVEVLRLVAEGFDTVEIAQKLSYSERMIKNVIHGMMTRLGLRTRSQAVAFALRSGAL